jgi:precorrin-6Y C5,15-methyltransferase (decarboxylating)
MWATTINLAGINNTIHVVGLGVAENAQLSDDARCALQHADIIFGSDRQLATIASIDFGISNVDNINDSETTKKQLLPPLSQLKIELNRLQNHTIVILASGDPLYYGIGRWVNNHCSASILYFYPAISSIQAACHQLGLSLQDVEVISLHGRPLVSIRRVLKAQKTLLILTDKHSQPHHIAKECVDAGFEQSRLWVCENLGYPQQCVREFSLDDVLTDKELSLKTSFDPLHVTIVSVQGKGDVLPEFPGIPDEHFSTGEVAGKGMISKREVRLAILSLLQTARQDVLWDIGAGCGGVAVELAHWHPRAAIYAIECHEQRLQHLAINRDRFGVVNNLHIVQGRAPEILPDLPAPNKVFIGGSDGELLKLLPYVWSLLPVAGVLVVSAVTDNTRNIVDDFISAHLDITPRQDGAKYIAGVESIDVAINRKKMIAGKADGKISRQWVEQKKLPVTLYRFKKSKNTI